MRLKRSNGGATSRAAFVGNGAVTDPVVYCASPPRRRRRQGAALSVPEQTGQA